jgi:hypothetical protein
MGKYYLVELQRFVDGGGKLTHEQGIRFLDEFLKQGGKLSLEDSLMLLHKLGSLLKNRKLPRLRVVSADVRRSAEAGSSASGRSSAEC